MSIAKGMDTCRLEDKVKFIFVIKEVMDYRTNKAGAILGERQTLGTKAMATSQMEKSIEISLKDISASTRQNEYRDKLAVIHSGQTKRNQEGGILPEFSRITAIRWCNLQKKKENNNQEQYSFIYLLNKESKEDENSFMVL